MEKGTSRLIGPAPLCEKLSAGPTAVLVKLSISAPGVSFTASAPWLLAASAHHLSVAVEPPAVSHTPLPLVLNWLTGAAKLVSDSVTVAETVTPSVLMTLSDDVLRMSSGFGLAGVPCDRWIEPLISSPPMV
jgi:hypothetical protein